MNKKKIYIISGIAAVVIIGGAITAAVVNANQSKETESVYKEAIVEKGNLVSGVTESGSVSLGTVSQTFEIESSSSTSSSGSTSSPGSAQSAKMEDSGSSSGTDAELVVEKVYVSLGENVQEGAAILKITDESLAEYREELESSVKSAELAVAEAELSAESQTLDAEYSYKENIANGSVAKEKYDATIASLNEEVTKAQEKLNESAAKIADYQQRIAAGENLATQLAEEQANYSSLENELKTAQSNLTTKSITAKQEYEKAMLNYNNASSILAVDTNGINDEVEEAQETLTEAQTALDEFNTLVGDGTIYAEYSGTILECGYSAGDVLSADTAILSVGEFITDSNDENKEKVCVLGANVAKEIFGSAIDAYDSILYIDGRPYVVNGILETMGTVSSGISPDDAIFIPYETGIKYLTGEDVNPSITVIADSVDEVDNVIEDITAVLAESYPNTEFTYTDAGSKMEAAFISLIGGVIGSMVSLLITPLVEKLGVRVELSATAFVTAIGFALFTGIVFGFYPAWKASKLVPVEALNAE